MRVILYTGKGGVGKTTTAAATAVKCAGLGHRTIVLSTDAAHSLSDIFETGIGASPTPIIEGLDAQEIDVAYELKHHWGVIQRYITAFLKSQGIEGIMAEEFAIVPGMEELFSLLKLKEYADSGAYEVAIVDCAPTASTLRMLGMPDAMRWYMDKFFHIERRIAKAVKPLAERLTKIPMPTDEIFFSAETLFRRVDAMKDLLTDAGKATVRLVCTPERMVVQESRRAFTTLSLFGLPVDAVITNRVLPEGLDAQYFKKWKTAQKRHIKEISRCFDPLRIFHLSLFDQEVTGVKLLTKVADDLFADTDPTDIFTTSNPMDISSGEDGYTLSLDLPLIDKSDLDLWTKEGELVIKAYNYQRNILLPQTLAGMKLAGARFEGQTLKINFRENNDA